MLEQTGFEFSHSCEMCLNPHAALQLRLDVLFLTAAATGVHAAQPRHANSFSFFFFSCKKQEAQSNLCQTQWLSLGSRSVTLCFAHLALFSHTDTRRLKTFPRDTPGTPSACTLNPCVRNTHAEKNKNKLYLLHARVQRDLRLDLFSSICHMRCPAA